MPHACKKSNRIRGVLINCFWRVCLKLPESRLVYIHAFFRGSWFDLICVISRSSVGFHQQQFQWSTFSPFILLTMHFKCRLRQLRTLYFVVTFYSLHTSVHEKSSCPFRHLLITQLWLATYEASHEFIHYWRQSLHADWNYQPAIHKHRKEAFIIIFCVSFSSEFPYSL